LPSFICEEVINSLKIFNLNIIYYKLDYNLSPNIDYLKKILNKKSLLLIVNYFGVPSNWKNIGLLKKEFNITLIEDNCHSLMQENGVGSFGDYSFNSLRKILPLLSGSQLQMSQTKYLNKNIMLNSKRYPDFDELKYFLRSYKPRGDKKRTVNNYKPNDEVIRRSKQIDLLSNNILIKNKFDIDYITSTRLDNFRFWNNFLKNNDFEFFDIDINKLFCPYVFPCIAKSKGIIKKWIQWGDNNNISIIQWPKFPFKTHDHFGNKNLNQVLLFPVNHQFNLSILLN